MRIRKRQVPLPLSLLSPVPLSDLKPFTTNPSHPVLQVVQLQPQSTQPPPAVPVLHHGPSPATPPSTAHDQPQPCGTHRHEATSRDPSRSSSDLRQKEGGIMITMAGQKELLIEGEEGSVDEDHHHHHHVHDHDSTRCTTSRSTSTRLDAAKSSESSTPYNNKLLNPPHSTSEVRRDGYRCQEEKSIPLKKRIRGTRTTTTAWSTTSNAESGDHKLMEEEGFDSHRKKNMMGRSSNVILCKTNKKGNDHLRPITTTHDSAAAAAGGGGGAHTNYHDSVNDGGDYRDLCHHHDQYQEAHVVLNTRESGFIQKVSTGAVISCNTYNYTTTATGTGAAASRSGKKRSSAASSGDTTGGGSRCSRVNGRGWRCNQPTLAAGYSLCQHHLGKGSRRIRRRISASCSSTNTTISTRVAIRNYCPQATGKQKLKPKKQLLRKNDNNITPTTDQDHDDHKEGHDHDTYNSSTTSKAAAVMSEKAEEEVVEEKKKMRRKKTKLSRSVAPDASTSSSDDIIQRVKFGMVKSRSLTSLLAEPDR